jgi:hypothetical protein
MSDAHFPDDAWKAARDATRADVRSVFAPRSHPCPRCGHVEEGPGRHCSQCGAEFVVHRSRGPSRRVVGAIVAALVLAGIAVALIVPGLRDSAGREQRVEAARHARLVAAERARVVAEQRPVVVRGPALKRGEDALAHRARLVAAGQAAITADAHARIRAGRLDGPVRGTDCTPYPATQLRTAQERDAAVPRNRYECLAYKTRFALPELQGKVRTGLYGTPYWLVLDYGSSKMTFCKITPHGGEAATTLVNVTAPAACQDPLRRR